VRWPFFAAFWYQVRAWSQLGWVPAVGQQQGQVVHGAGGPGIGGPFPPDAGPVQLGWVVPLVC
jgi:hypothetical protein